MAYLHKKFKKLASVESQEPEPAPPPPPQHEGTQLKHSIGSMVAPAPAPAPELETRDQGGDSRHRKHIRLHADTRAAQHSEAGVVLRPAPSHPAPALGPGLVVLPSHLVRPVYPPPPQHPPYHLPPPGLRFLEPVMNGQLAAAPRQEAAPAPHHQHQHLLVRHRDPRELHPAHHLVSPGYREARPPPPPPHHYDLQHERLQPRDRDGLHQVG